MNPQAWEHHTQQHMTQGEFARTVSQLADGPAAVIATCPDRDMRECAEQLAAARAVGRMHYRMREATR